jgi:hypothetical protein
MVACPLPEVALTLVGASGVVAGVTELLAEEAELVPSALLAVTVKVYGEPLLRPFTTTDVAPLVVALNPPVFEVTTYVVIAEPPLLAGADHETSALPLLAVALTEVGASGIVAGMTELLVPEEELVPTALVAVTVKV